MLTANNWKNFQYGKELMEKVVYPAFENAKIPDLANMKLCGSVINVIECKACHTKHYAGNWRCKNRWCINCNRVKVKAWIARLVPILKEWLEAGNYITILNLTIKDTERLTEGLKLLESSFRSMQNGDKEFRKKWKDRFPGGVRSLEVKRGKNSKDWHPHFHCLTMQNYYNKDFNWVRDAWERFTWQCSGNDYSQYAKLSRKEKDKQKIGSVWLKEITSEDLLVGVVETLKYIMKPELSLFKNTEDLTEAWVELKGKRQVNTWGLLRGLGKLVDEDIEHTEEKKLTEFICQQCGCTEGHLESVLYTELSDLVLFDC